MTATTTSTSSRLAATGLSLGYAGTPVVHDLDLRVPDGKVTVIVGANACGKSTLLRGLARLLRPRSGAVLLDGEAIHRRPTRQVARVLGLLPQDPVAPEGVTVVDLVGRGRHPHHGPFRRWTSADDEAVAEALALTDTVALADRVVDELSGGQRQRVWIAMALAQGTDLLLLDEPTTYLDVAHQVEMLDLLADLNARRGTTIVMVLHDLNLSARYADHLVALRGGRVVAEGSPRQVVTEEVVREVFGLDNRVIDDPVSHTPLVVPVGRHLRAIPSDIHSAITQENR
jgi:iron complex transport system ATP-binding protein